MISRCCVPVHIAESLVIRRAYGRGMGGFSLGIAGGISVIAGVALFLSTMHGEQLTLLLAVISLAHVRQGLERRGARMYC